MNKKTSQDRIVAEKYTASLQEEEEEPLNLAQKRITIDFPIWMISKVDKEAQKMGISRQAVVKYWIAEKIKQDSLAW